MNIGIYSITNKTNGKKYVGKSSNIKRRFTAHKNSLKKKNQGKGVNRYLFNSVQKYGIDNFSFDIIETFDQVDEELLKERELYWMDYYNSCNRNFGYNLRRDSSTGMITHDETKILISKLNRGSNNPNYGNYWTEEMKLKMSNIAKDRHSSGKYYTEEWYNKVSESCSKMWKDEDRKNRMREKVRIKAQKYIFHQYNKDGSFVKTWNSINDLRNHYPNLHDQSIYSVCSGYKKSYMGYIWKKTKI